MKILSRRCANRVGGVALFRASGDVDKVSHCPFHNAGARFMQLRHLAVAGALAACAAAALADQDTTGIAFPDGYRNWFHHHTTVNLPGHQPDGNVGIQDVYANALALAGLKSGTYADGAVFVVDRYRIVEGDNHTLSQGDRKVVAVMVRDAKRYAETGGWGFQAFKGGDPAQLAVKDGGKACFVCHIPHADNSYLFTRGVK
jgi:hypothetical protein